MPMDPSCGVITAEELDRAQRCVDSLAARTGRARIGRVLGLVALAVAATGAACKSDAPVRNPATTAGATATATDDDIGAARYGVCRGQGGNPGQLAPTFLDQMESCQSTDAPESLAARGGEGTIIAGKGDCQFQQGISCHFHTSMEFVSANHLKDDEHGVGEMHCIVPSANANSPTVYGAHLRCKSGTRPEAGTHACSNALLQLVDRGGCHDGWKCCDNGTLTKPVGKQTPAERLLRPDFRICQDEAIEVDCAVFHGMHGHTANVVGLGEEYTGNFNGEKETHALAH